ncbi:hypothetical protein TNCV_4097601 [Trichonephila clavipes]|nr:hypothetical protein TNCV_4097601 [Trichonephila clavipes]
MLVGLLSRWCFPYSGHGRRQWAGRTVGFGGLRKIKSKFVQADEKLVCYWSSESVSENSIRCAWCRWVPVWVKPAPPQFWASFSCWPPSLFAIHSEQKRPLASLAIDLIFVRSCVDACLVGGANGGGEKEILSSSTLGFRMPEKSDKRTELFKLLRKSDQQVVTARALS